MILETVQQAREKTGQPLADILASLGVPPATYYRWQGRAAEDHLADVVVVPCRRTVPPTPEEVGALRGFALTHPQTGYKRLAWQMVDEDVAYLRPYQVYPILTEHELLCRRASPPAEALRRPPEPDHPDQVWHIDLMYLYIRPRWYYLVDILDGYSRFLVHWSLNLTMLADTVTLTVQEALERLPEHRPAGEPRLVHDHGSQFLSAEWRLFHRRGWGHGHQDPGGPSGVQWAAGTTAPHPSGRRADRGGLGQLLSSPGRHDPLEPLL